MNRRDVIASGTALAATLATRAAGAAVPTQAAMIERKIPATGIALPVIGLGTSGPFEVGANEDDRRDIRDVLTAFLAEGGRVIDTSPMYSTAEAVLGEELTPLQNAKAFLATKVWTDGERAGAEQIGRSAQLLHRSKLDLVQVHNLRDLDTHLETLGDLRKDGKVAHIGVTHYTVASHADLEKVIKRERIDFVQLNYSAMTRDAEKSLLPLAADRGVAVLVNRAFEDGKIFARLRDRPLPAWAAEIDCTSWAQMLLKYVISHPAVTCVIPATGKLRNLRDNMQAGRGRLPDTALRQRIVAAIA